MLVVWGLCLEWKVGGLFIFMWVVISLSIVVIVVKVFMLFWIGEYFV